MINSKPLISVIMPVYNAGPYLSAAIESVLSQTYKDFELILIDDGATDGSSQKCDYYKSIDSRIIVIHQQNSGISAARNTGLSYASGEYIAFCDHDDEYSNDYLMKSLNNIESLSVDLLKFEYKTIHIGSGFQRESVIQSRPGIYSLNDVASDHDLLNQSLRALWNGLYKKCIIDDNCLRFDEFYKTGVEDYDFNLNYLSYCKSIGIVDEILFVHYIRDNQSADTSFSLNKLDSWIKMMNKEYDFIVKKRVSSPLLYMKSDYSYLSSIISTLLSKNCHWNLSKKRKYLNDLRKIDPFIKDLTWIVLFKYCHTDYSKNVLLILYYLKLFYLCFAFMSIKHRIWDYIHTMH